MSKAVYHHRTSIQTHIRTPEHRIHDVQQQNGHGYDKHHRDFPERCLEYLVGKKEGVLKAYRWLYILAVLIGPFLTVSAVWTLADIMNGLMALPNLVALVALSGVVVKETKDFFEKEAHMKLQ